MYTFSRKRNENSKNDHHFHNLFLNLSVHGVYSLRKCIRSANLYKLHEEAAETECLFYAIEIVALPVPYGVIILVGWNSALCQIQSSMVILSNKIPDSINAHQKSKYFS